MNQINLPEIYDIWPTSFFHTYLGLSLIFFAIILVLAAIFLVVKFLTKKKKIPYWLQTENKLNDLLVDFKRDIFSSNEIYRKLTKILKEYIQNRNEFLKVGLTDFELLEYLRNKQFDEKLIKFVTLIFENAQEAKFANVQIMKDKIESDITNCLLFVCATKPKEEK